MENFDSENQFFKRKRNAQSESSVLLRRNKKSVRTKSAEEEGGSPTAPSIIVTAPNRLFLPNPQTNHGYRLSNSSSLPVENEELEDIVSVEDTIDSRSQSGRSSATASTVRNYGSRSKNVQEDTRKTAKPGNFRNYRSITIDNLQHSVEKRKRKISELSVKSGRIIPPHIYIHLCCFLITLPTGIVLMMISWNPIKHKHGKIEEVNDLHYVVTVFLRSLSTVLMLIGFYNVVAAFKVRSMPPESVREDSTSGYETLNSCNFSHNNNKRVKRYCESTESSSFAQSVDYGLRGPSFQIYRCLLEKKHEKNR